MYVLSVKGSSKNKKVYYYLNVNDNNVMSFNTSYADCLQFDDANKAYQYGIDNYMTILKAMLDTPVRLYSNTFAVRKIIFKTIKPVVIDPSVKSSKGVDDDKEENTDAFNESSNNELESDTIVETEVPEYVEEAGSSDIQ